MLPTAKKKSAVSRVVLDTNIVVSGLLWTGAPARIIDAAIDEQITLLTSEQLITELKTVLSRSKFERHFTVLGKSVEAFMDGYRALATVIEAPPIEPAIIADPTDDAVLACAAAGKAEYIISGDKHLLSVGSYAGIAILSANEFLDVHLN